MKKFEIGKEYFDRSACNHDCIFTIKIIKRTEKTVTFERNGKTRRAKLFFDERGEYIIPERYSMVNLYTVTVWQVSPAFSSGDGNWGLCTASG